MTQAIPEVRYDDAYATIMIDDTNGVSLVFDSIDDDNIDSLIHVPELCGNSVSPISIESIKSLDARGMRFFMLTQSDLDKAQALGIRGCIRCALCEKRLAPRGEEPVCDCEAEYRSVD
jgi:hypothetical protein